MTPPRALSALLALLVAELVVCLITGDISPDGFFARSLLIVALAIARLWFHGPRTPDRAAWLLLGLLLLPAAFQLQFAGGRISGDGVMYYVYVRSLVKDGDLDFANEYAHYEIVDRDDLSMLTDTGRRRSIFAVGPGLAWIPFFVLGEGVARVQGALGAPVDLSGYGPHHRNAVALGSLLYGFATVALIYAMLRRHFEVTIALGAALLIWGATFLHWYMVQQPMMAHAVSAAGAAFVIWLWDRSRGRRTAAGFLGLGLLGGFAMCLRWQNGVLLVLPALELAERWWRGEVRIPRALALFAGMVSGVLLGAVPQMLAWRYIYGHYLLPHPPHGADFLRLDHPYLLQTLFSSRHGLLSWTPVFWLGFLGFIPLVRRRPGLALPLLLPLTLMTYVNACSGDWWAGASFSIRRFDSQLAIVAVGFAAALESLRRAIVRRPGLVPSAIAALFVIWNAGLVVQARRGQLADPMANAFPALFGRTAQVVAEHAGSPTTWPASWLFAWQHGRPAAQYDRLVGRYLFYRQNNMKGRVDLGQPGDAVMLGEGWGEPEIHLSVPARRMAGAARLFAPLDVPEDLGVRVRTAALADAVEVSVRVNGHAAGRFVAPRSWNEHEVYVPAQLWRRELNDVVLEAAAPGVSVDQVNFIKEPIRR